MPITLKIRNRLNSSKEIEKEFFEELLSLGRLTENTVPLLDEQRTISRKHAEIALKNQLYYLRDKQSRNKTFLNDVELVGEQDYELHEGDCIRIGDYLIKVLRIQQPSLKDDVTRPAWNPFQEAIQELSQTLEKINNIYAKSHELGADLLSNALHYGLPLHGQEEVRAVVARELSKGSAVKTGIQQEPESGRILEEFFPREVGPTSSALGEVTRILLKHFLQLHKGLRKFNLEFIGTTDIQSSEGFSLNTCTEQELFDYLNNAASAMQGQPNELIEKASSRIDRHHLSLLEGYKTAVDSGLSAVTEELSPLKIKSALMSQSLQIGPIKIPYRFLPIINHLALLKRILAKHREFAAEDRVYIERKLFRPGFINGYQEYFRHLAADR